MSDLCPNCRAAGGKNWCRVEWCDGYVPPPDADAAPSGGSGG